jgi:hypothetical protein
MMPEKRRARAGNAGAAKTIAGGAKAFPASSISLPDTTCPSVFVGAADLRRRAWLIDLGRIAAAALPAGALARVKAAWARILDSELGGGR